MDSHPNNQILGIVKIEKNSTFATNSDFDIPISLQFDDVTCNLTKFIVLRHKVSNIKG